MTAAIHSELTACDFMRLAARIDVSATARAVLLIMFDNMDAEGALCLLSQRELAERAHISQRQIVRIMSEITSANLFALQRRGGAGKGRLPNAYALTEHCANLASCHQQRANLASSQKQQDAKLADGALPKTPRAATNLPEWRVAKNNPPLEPPITTTPPSEVSEQPSKVAAELEGGSGETFELTPPGRKRRAKKLAVAATEATLPATLTVGMRAAADNAGFLNGTGEAEFCAWRDHHLTKATTIADPDASFRTWLRNAKKFAARDAAKAAPSPARYRRGVYPMQAGGGQA